MIRRATIGDAETLADIHQASFETAWDANTLSNSIERDLVLIAGSPAHAFIIVQQVLDEGEVITLAVAPQARQQGVAKMLLETTLNTAMTNGVTRIFLEVAADNLPALALYQRAGFAQIGLRKAYYGRANEPRADAVTMARALTTPPIATSS